MIRYGALYSTFILLSVVFIDDACAVDGNYFVTATASEKNDSNLSLVRDASPIELQKSILLDGSNYSPGRGFLIRKSNIVLDCNGLEIDGMGVAPFGVDINSFGKKISNIVVRNCKFKNFRYRGASVGWRVKLSEKKSLLGERPENFLYGMHPSSVLFYNDVFVGSGTAGVYVDAFSSFVQIEKSTFLDNKGVAIYLEYSSSQTSILDNYFYNNGFVKGREAIAIDSSSKNIISRNFFKKNNSGGVFLYKNCGERFPGSEFITRKYGSNYNIITNNSFFGERVGVWLASRQSRDLSTWNCSDPTIFEGKYYQDYASDNKVVDNSFCGVAQPVIVEDDNNVIANNRIDGQSLAKAVRVTNPPRAIYMHKPVIGTVIRDNVQTQCN